MGGTKRLRDNETAENPRKAPRMDEDNILAAGDKGDLGGAKADSLSNADLNAVKGMPNLGNTCYLNALVQCLLALGKLRKMILEPKANLGVMGMALKDLFVKTSSLNNTGDLMDPAFVTACIRAWDGNFKGTEMQDSQELFISLLSRLGEEEKEDESSNPPHLHDGIPISGMTEIFFGQLCLKTSCSCSKEKLEYVPFNDLGLSMPTRAKNAGDLDQLQQYKDCLIEDCLGQFFQEEKMAFCCSSALDNQEELQKQGATRAISITKLPEIFVIYLKRYIMDSDRTNAIKLSGYVSFEELLNVGQFMEPSSEDKTSIYYLAGVIEHIGTSPTSGHYVAYVKEKVGGWLRVSDTISEKVPLQEVLQCEAYMLFYERG